MSIVTVLLEIEAERKRQNGIWGGPEHDDTHTVSEWFDFFVDYFKQARSAYSLSDHPLLRRKLIQVAALIVAFIETRDRKDLPPQEMVPIVLRAPSQRSETSMEAGEAQEEDPRQIEACAAFAVRWVARQGRKGSTIDECLQEAERLGLPFKHTTLSARFTTLTKEKVGVFTRPGEKRNTRSFKWRKDGTKSFFKGFVHVRTDKPTQWDDPESEDERSQ